MTIIDRYLLRQFVQVYVICWISLTGLYIVFDAFSNLDEFMRYSEKGDSLLALMGSFYAYRSIFFFDRTSAILAMTSAMFTVTWIQRHNELTALMAAGISRRRIVVPVIAAAVTISVLAALSRELVMPGIRSELSRDAKDLKGDLPQPIRSRYDNLTDILFEGQFAVTATEQIHRPSFRLPESIDGEGRRLMAEDCFYQGARGARPAGYWFRGVTHPLDLLKSPSLELHGRPIVITPASEPRWLQPDECFVVSELSFEQLMGGRGWRQFSSTPALVAGLRNRSLDFGADVRVAIHSRVVQPFLDVTLLFLGLPLVLSRENRNMFMAVGLCLALVAGFMTVVLACQYLGTSLLISPALASWLPLMVFAPAAVAMYDRVER